MSALGTPACLLESTFTESLTAIKNTPYQITVQSLKQEWFTGLENQMNKIS
jgi:hypothetical protein